MLDIHNFFYFKRCGPYVVNIHNWTLMLELYMARLVNNGHQSDMYDNEIILYPQNMSTISYSTINNT
jgi:hypothetical protein